MITALDLANAIVYLYADKAYITNNKLNNLVYFAYSRELRKGNKIFEDEMYAWKYGYIVASVYECYKNAGSGPISHSTLEDEPSEVALNFAKDIWDDFGEFGAWDLMEIYHGKGSVWSKLFVGDGKTGISDEDIYNSIDGNKPKLDNSFAKASKEAFESLDKVLKMLVDA